MPESGLLCPRCHAQVHPGWGFCSHCGSRLDLAAGEAPTCENCGAVVDPTTSACWKCGESFAPGPAPAPTAGSTVPAGAAVPSGRASGSAPVGATVRTGGPAPAPDQPTCDNCGASVDTSGSFCWKCGVPLTTGREPFIPALAASGDPGAAVGPSGRGWSGARASPSALRPSGDRAMLPGVLFLAAVAVLVLSLFVAWYGVTASASATEFGQTITVHGNDQLYLLNHLTVVFDCTGTSYCFGNSSYSGTYSGSGLNDVSTLYWVISGLVIAGVAVGLFAAIAVLRSGGRRSGLPVLLCCLALALAAIAPVALAVAQPMVLHSQDTSPDGQNSSAGPATSFFGSCSGSSCGGSVPSGDTDSGAWGPSLGWFASLAAAGLFGVGLWIRGPSRRGRGPGSGS
jgi:hypothetical protein